MSAATPEPTRAAGLRRLQDFAPSAGADYAKARNFDFGAKRRGNVSTLSPYLRHRLVLEPEVLETTLRLHAPADAGKFVEEVFWRGYFKGWLEQRPDVWADYSDDLNTLVQQLDDDAGLAERYIKAVDGSTGIDCFDEWASELVSTGYLHNHARMWFASIWIYTLGLPWQLGADFFYRHLADGDPASNTLSWRWVCGLHTPGKTYLARAANIAKFTENRFNPDGQLATSAPPVADTRTYPVRPLPDLQTLPPKLRFGLLITEEDGCPGLPLGGQRPVAILGALATRMRSPLKTGDRAVEFAAGAVADALARATLGLEADGEISESRDWPGAIVDWASRHRLRAVVTAYAPVGPVAELLAKVGRELACHDIRLIELRREYDSTTWPHAQRGYFKLKKQIPAILERLAIPAAHDGAL